MPEKEETERTTMLWPVDVKEAVRERVGPRGLTDFTVAAVREKLGQPVPDAELAESKELGDARFLVQRLADCIAMSGEYEDRESVLREIDLPPWVQTIGWPENLARAINPIEPVGQVVETDTRPDIPADNSEPDIESPQVSGPAEVDTAVGNSVDEQPLIDHEYEAGYSGFACVRMVFKNGAGEDCGMPAAAHRQPEAPGVGDNVIAEPPKVSHSNDLFKRLQAKAAEKGVDISGVDLKPASEIERPEVKTLTAEEVGWKLETEPEAEPNGVKGMHPQIPEGVDITQSETYIPPEDVHNHSWSKFEDVDGLYVGQPYFCACGAVMDKDRFYERDEVPTKALTPSTPEPPSWQQRAEQMDVDF